MWKDRRKTAEEKRKKIEWVKKWNGGSRQWKREGREGKGKEGNEFRSKRCHYPTPFTLLHHKIQGRISPFRPHGHMGPWAKGKRKRRRSRTSIMSLAGDAYQSLLPREGTFNYHVKRIKNNKIKSNIRFGAARSLH